MLIHRLLYQSDCAVAGTPAQVEATVQAIVRFSQLANQAAGLTGALMFSSGVFVQVLEGPLLALEATFERICSDLRHKRVRLLDLAVTEERAFEDWSMVSIAQAIDLDRLYPTPARAQGFRLDAATAQSAIQMMQTLLPTNLPVRDTALVVA